MADFDVKRGGDLIKMITGSQMTSKSGAADVQPSSGQAWLVTGVAGAPSVLFKNVSNSTPTFSWTEENYFGFRALITNTVYMNVSAACYISAGTFADPNNVVSGIVAPSGGIFQPASGETYLVTCIQGGSPRLTDGTNDSGSNLGEPTVRSGFYLEISTTLLIFNCDFMITNNLYLKNAHASNYMYVSAYRVRP